MPALPLGSETLNMSKVLVALIVGAGPGISAAEREAAYWCRLRFGDRSRADRARIAPRETALSLRHKRTQIRS